MLRFGFLGAVLLASLLLWPLHVQAQSLEATAVAERQRDFGRLTLDFRNRLDLPAYEIDAENGVLRIVFDQPVETEISDVIRVLSDFVTIARQDPDGRALRFGLARSVRINTMEAGEMLFIDFLPASWQGFPPPLPEEVVERLAQRASQAAREAAEAERRRLLGELEPEVSLRVGAAPTFTRYAFNWNVPFNVAVTQEGPQLTMVFDYDVPIDLGPALIDQAEELEDIAFSRDGASLTLTMDVRPGSGLRWFEDQQRFIVDLEREMPLSVDEVDREELDRLMESLAPEAGEPAEDVTQFSSVAARPSDVVVPRPVDAVSEVTRALEPSTIEPRSADTPSEDTAEMGQAELQTETDTEAPMSQEAQADGSSVRPAMNVLPLSQRPDVASAPVLRTGLAAEVQETLEESGDPFMVRVDVRSDGDMKRLLFPFSQPTPAAAFTRSSFVTLVFQSPVPLDLRALRLELSDLVRSIESTRMSDMNLIHIEFRDDTLVSMAPSGDRWIVTLGSSLVQPPRGLEVGRAVYPDGLAYAEIEGQGFGAMRRITHPHVGDELVVIPMLGPAQGVLARRELVEFDVLASSQGLVVRPKIDGLSVDVEDERVVISREQGLSLSEVGLPLASLGFAPDERSGYFDLAAYAGEGPSIFKDRFEAYQNAIALADGPVRLERLMSFARFLVAFNLGQEANGVLDVALSEAPALDHDESYLTVRAAALTMAGRHEETLEIIDSYLMEGEPDAQLWGLMSNAALHNWPEVNTAFDEVAALFGDYPPRIVSRARLDGIEAALNVQAIDIAVDRLSQVDAGRLIDSPLQGRLDLLQARVELSRGRIEAAIETFDRIRDTNAGAVGAEASLRAIMARIDTDAITLEEGLDQLENLAVAWRGDDTEIRTRRLLGDLYVEQGRYAEALTALKGILIAQPDHPTANDVSDAMQNIFVDLFLNGEADQMAAIDALSLFYDFRELTPIGRRGDELVRRLADRLVSIDLLEQAADLLHHQVDNRLTGAAKAQVAADLALIYLMDFRPSEAVAVLQRTRISQVPMSIERGRRVIEARALSELGRDELALEMLRGMEGTDVAEVRADILWNAERWEEAGGVLERLLGERWNDRVPLGEDEMQQVLRTAIAFSFAGDEYALERLRARYEAKMSDGVYASAFDVVTAPIEAQGTAFRDVARSIAGLNTLSRFLADYRSRFSGETLPETMPGA